MRQATILYSYRAVVITTYLHMYLCLFILHTTWRVDMAPPPKRERDFHSRVGMLNDNNPVRYLGR